MPGWLHSTRRTAAAAAFVLLLSPLGGCALFDKETWNPERYRDERSVDIERRLERTEPIVKNPF